MNTKLTVLINGTKYAITTTEDPDYVQGLAGEIDVLITNMMKGSTMSINHALLLAALHYLDQCKKTDENSNHLRKQISEYGKESSKARSELFEAKKEISKLRQASLNDKK